MKAAFALLANTEIHNFVRKLAWRIHRAYRTGTDICRLPPHVSLKQPFEVADLAALEAFMDEFAPTLQPFEIMCTGLQVISTVFEGAETGLLWLNVQETPTLRRLHERLNRELSRRFEATQAAFDGAMYHFHMTVMMGGQPVEVYRKFYNEIPERAVALTFTADTLALFVYDDPLRLDGDYMVYKVLPVGSKA
jgi:2'-5' RNA ligase